MHGQQNIKKSSWLFILLFYYLICNQGYEISFYAKLQGKLTFSMRVTVLTQTILLKLLLAPADNE